MEWFISHDSALEYWRLRCNLRAGNQPEKQLGQLPGQPRGQIKRARAKTPPAYPPSTKQLARRNPWGLSSPLHILVAEDSARKVSKTIVSHIYGGTLPPGVFFDAGFALLVSSPEFCFLQMAARLSLHRLIELGFELCGTYSLGRSSGGDVQGEQPAQGAPAALDARIPQSAQGVQAPQTPQSDPNSSSPSTEVLASLAVLVPPASPVQAGFVTIAAPLTSVSKLKAFLDKVPGACNIDKARRALRYIIDGSASPMETLLAMMLTLPYKLGGYGLKMPLLNARIDVGKAARPVVAKAYYRCDIYWPEAGLAVEYDSDAHHAGAERIAKDSKRRNALAFMGVTVVTVTRQQIYSWPEFDKVARLLAKHLGKQLRLKGSQFSVSHAELRKLLPRAV